MKRLVLTLATAALLSCGTVRQVHAGSVVTPGGQVNVTDDNDPLGNSFSGSVNASTSPVSFDNGLLTLTETITPVNATSAWVVFHINATNGLPLVGNPSGFADISINGIPTQSSVAFGKFFTGYDVNGVDDPFPFPVTGSIGPNPITGTGSVFNGTLDPPSFSQTLFADIDPYNQGPTNYGNSPSNTPTGFTIGALYAVQTAVPEPGSLTLAGLATAGLAFRTWRRRSAR
jgi:PEP-CTERM motif